jgi:hypothetical protein
MMIECIPCVSLVIQYASDEITGLKRTVQINLEHNTGHYIRQADQNQ